ncbi:BRISC complex subunit Abraxas 2-like isoform X2 [Hetaerina americana]
MAVNVCVSTSGPVLSFLLYENVNSTSNQEGFLLGEVVSKETNTISDFQINGKETATLISVHSVMPVPHKFAFYNNTGKVNEKKLKDIVKDKSKDIVGWFRFRRNTTLVPHLTDKVIHQQLSEILTTDKKDVFTMCILSASKSSNESTHRFNHIFYIHKYSEFEAIPLSVENLGDTSISGYKLVSNTSCSSESFQSIVSGLAVSQEFSEAHLVLNMQILIKMHLQKLVQDLANSEAKVSTLQKEVDLLKSQLKSGKISNELLLPQLLSMPIEAAPENICSSSDAVSNHQSITIKTDIEGDSELEEKLNGKEDPVITSDLCSEDDLKEQEASTSPSPSKSSGDPFDFVTELKLKMTPPPGGRRHPGSNVDNLNATKGNNASGATGSKRKQSARGNTSSPSPTTASSVGDTSAGKSPVTRHLRSSPQRSVRKISTPESQRQSRSRQNSTSRNSASAANSANEN